MRPLTGFFIIFTINHVLCQNYTILPGDQIVKYNPERDVEFHLYTRKNPNEHQIIEYQNISSIFESHFRLYKPVKIFSPGKTTSASSHLSLKHKDPFLLAGDVNVINIEWVKGSVGDLKEIGIAAGNTGKFVSKFIDWLNEIGVSFEDIHLIGVSIGSRVVSHAGRFTTKGKVAYLTACDPPQTHWENPKEWVSKKDARYVEVIHSNTKYHGLRKPLGHVDFYPNWGSLMPGCEKTLRPNDCSHIRAYDYFSHSIGNKHFMGVKCNDFAEIEHRKCSNGSLLHMGGIEPKNKTGLYYVKTTASAPYYDVS